MEFIHPLTPDPDEAAAAVVGWHHDSVAAKDFPPHRHRRAQLMHVSAGVVVVTVEGGSWVVPPFRAVWIPGGLEHSARYPRGVALRHLYVDVGTVEIELPKVCVLLQLDPLAKEAIKAVAEQPWEAGISGPGARLAAVVLDKVASAARSDVHLPAGKDKRVLRVMAALQENPADQRSIEALADVARASPRTIARLFKEDTGLTFGTWRQQLRLQEAIVRMAAGESITRVAHDLGYGSASSFTTMFRNAMGVAPARYLKGDR